MITHAVQLVELFQGALDGAHVLIPDRVEAFVCKSGERRFALYCRIRTDQAVGFGSFRSPKAAQAGLVDLLYPEFDVPPLFVIRPLEPLP